ncbi:uroporphyrinogen-III synthase [Sphingomonas profundi]|uniref:uroporphyrinogen-III synthase n=1 Tax=Alterirhizorhabdus profundi TaxID=2681549 RepID=UPI0012E96F29|nr:uroporphyrinogen-III synthase [Sphingomonas profundi]
MSGTLLILRPEPGAAATARRAASLGFATVATPLFVVRPIAWAAPDPAAFDALLLTSASAVRAGGDGLARYLALPVHAVGEATAAAARAAGFATVHAGEGDAAALAAGLARSGVRRALHLAGREHRPLVADGVAVETRIVYAADPAAALAPAAAAAARAGAVALLHSPRAAALYRALALAGGLATEGLTIAAISPAALSAAGTNWRATAAATDPTDEALLAAAARLCDQGRGTEG